MTLFELDRLTAYISSKAATHPVHSLPSPLFCSLKLQCKDLCCVVDKCKNLLHIVLLWNHQQQNEGNKHALQKHIPIRDRQRSSIDSRNIPAKCG